MHSKVLSVKNVNLINQADVYIANVSGEARFTGVQWQNP